jgi:hypothetical protein
MDINLFRKALASKQKLLQEGDPAAAIKLKHGHVIIVSVGDIINIITDSGRHYDNVVVTRVLADHKTGTGGNVGFRQGSADMDISGNQINHLQIVKYRVGPLKEGVARKDHAAADWHTLKTHGSGVMVFAGSEWIGAIDHIPGSTVVPLSSPQYVAKLNAGYRDSRLKIHRPVERTIGTFNSQEAALAALKQAVAALSK